MGDTLALYNGGITYGLADVIDEHIFSNPWYKKPLYLKVLFDKIAGMKTTEYSLLDQAILHFDQGMRILFTPPVTTGRAYPAAEKTEANQSTAQKQHVAGLMRVNHAGEIAAQGLYQGQAITADLMDVRAAMERAASEESDHLAWCEQRLAELNSQTSYLDPLWYLGSLVIGMTAGAMGDNISLGFVVETEKQVVEHLQEHMTQLSADDLRTQAILEQMITDEAHHADTAHDAGGVDLPLPVKIAMRYTARVMKTTAYYI